MHQIFFRGFFSFFFYFCIFYCTFIIILDEQSMVSRRNLVPEIEQLITEVSQKKVPPFVFRLYLVNRWTKLHEILTEDTSIDSKWCE